VTFPKTLGFFFLPFRPWNNHFTNLMTFPGFSTTVRTPVKMNGGRLDRPACVAFYGGYLWCCGRRRRSARWCRCSWRSRPRSGSGTSAVPLWSSAAPCTCGPWRSLWSSSLGGTRTSAAGGRGRGDEIMYVHINDLKCLCNRGHTRVDQWVSRTLNHISKTTFFYLSRCKHEIVRECHI